MTPAVKFCGLTRPEDAAAAAAAGAAYAGVVFAGGARRVTAERAREVLDAAGAAVRRVGVFGADGGREVGAMARLAGLDIVQLHADPVPADVEEARAETDAEVWAAVRVEGAAAPAGLEALAEVANAIVLDSRVAGAMGGTGRAFDWMAIAPTLSRLRGRVRLVLAGGLTPENVSRAIELLAPDVVDVSTGVELTPGVKDGARMRAFVEAVRAT